MTRKMFTSLVITGFLLASALDPAMSSAQPGGGGAQGGDVDHQHMMEILGVKALRSGADPNNQTTFDEAIANPYKDTMPDVLTLKDGTKVTRADQWPKRRAEILEDFEREVYGRIPKDVPKVTWAVTSTTRGMSGNIPTVTKVLAGHVDNSAYPQISVEIQASYTVPANATAPVPIMIEFGGFFGGGGRGMAGFGGRGMAGFGGRGRGGFGARGGAAFTSGTARGFGGFGARGAMAFTSGTARGRGAAPAMGMMGMNRGSSGPPWTQQAIAKGWGYGYINPGSIQPDNGAGLTRGIIGLVNKGQPRKPEDWGSLRAWQWGVSRLIDYFEANPDSKVDPKKVGIEGVSRYGKAALVTEAFEERIAVGFIASSGEGGAKLHRHIFGESVENLAGGEYYWMAGNFIKYGASEPKKTAADLPVDSHELIALCAPRLCFLSHGVVERGDAKWIDAHGAFMAGVLAGPVYRLLGKKDLGTPGNYLADPMPAVKELIGGELAWRQHDGGHESTPNWPAFFEWVGHYIQAPPLPAAPAAK